MSKFELTISPNYVPSWTIVDAIRELFQNALDQEKQKPGNKASWSYDEATETLTISNATSVLEAKSLLLGQTTKADDKSTIGQFGEGYKVATLVLLRNSKGITFYNYGAKEIWRPKFVKSRKYNSTILTFITEKVAIWEKVPSADLVIEISGITKDEYYNQIVPSNLHLNTNVKVIETTHYGDIITMPGKVFVNGLYVCDYEPYEYGYNFKPEYLKLDRDRKMVSDFDLRWVASQVWNSSSNRDKVVDMISKGVADVAYVEALSGNPCWNKLSAEKFKSVYGNEAIPVSTQADLERVPKGYKGILVPSQYCKLIKNYEDFNMPDLEPDHTSPLYELQEWYDEIKHKLLPSQRESFDIIYDKLRRDLNDKRQPW